jgi:diacylglycerol kinase family enzyme
MQQLRPIAAPTPPRIAVVLNGNARAVKAEVIQALGGVLRDEDIFVTRSTEQGRFIARTIVNRGYEVVVCGGGDGTFSQCVTDVLALRRPGGEPAFGVLRLGTGNALATALGASSPTAAGLAADLRLAADPAARRELGMLQVEGRLAPFAGVGLDALILEDYNAVKQALRRTPARALGEGAAGYALAVGSRSLLRLLREPRPEVLIRNLGEPAQRIDTRGRPLGRPVPRGAVLYRGPVLIAAASTVPYYGLGLKLFPQAGARVDRFQLRVADVDPFRILLKLPALFRGELEDPGILDFLCTRVSIQLAKPGAVQVGGDEIGRRSSLQLGLRRVTAVARGEAPLAERALLERAVGGAV